MQISSPVISFFLKAHQWSDHVGLLKSPWFRQVFFRSYFVYKKLLEDPFYALSRKRPDLFKDGNILDIGASIGYTAALFSRVLADGYSVFTFEPDEKNFSYLQECLKRSLQSGKIIAVHAAVGAQMGEIEFWHNQAHLGDHRVLTPAFAKSLGDSQSVRKVRLVSVDGFLEKQKIHDRVSFVKMDVQGYELAVCQGMQSTLEKNPACTIAVEYSPEDLVEMGVEPRAVLDFLSARNYQLFFLVARGRLLPYREETLAILLKQNGYVNLLASQRNLLTPLG